MDRSGTISPHLLDFLNSGLLPFAGRGAELALIGRLLAPTVEAGVLRSVVVAGEAGVGKSRFAEAVAEQFERDGGVAVVVRLYPDTASALAAPLADAAARAIEARGLLREEPPRDLPGAVMVLRRAARLRPTLVVLDDLHLLSGDGVAELGRLLGALDDEPLALLGLLRPGDAPARAVVERSLVAEIELGGLDVDELQPLLADLFPGAAGSLLGALHAATGGNMMAVRSALRSAVAGGGLRPDASGRGWSVQNERFSAAVERSLELVAGGMIAHLGEAELAAAVRLTLLGTLFARETAAVVVSDLRVLDTLIFKGVLAPVAAGPAALGVRESSRPLLAFTHNLLYRSLRERAVAEPRPVLEILARELPLYTLDPIRLLAGAPPDRAWPEELLYDAVRGLLYITRRMDNSQEWRLAGEPYLCAARLVQFNLMRWEEERWHDLLCYLLYWGWMLQRRRPAQMSLHLVAALDRASRAPATVRERRWRLKALRQQYRVGWEVDRVEREDLLEEMRRIVGDTEDEDLLADYPHILFIPLSIAVRTNNYPLIDEIEAEVERLLASPGCTDQVRTQVHHNITAYLLNVLRTPEELERRRRMLADSTGMGGGSLVDHLKLVFRLDAGDVWSVMGELRSVLEALVLQGLSAGAIDLRGREILATWMLNGDTGAALERLQSLVEEVAAASLPDALLTRIAGFMVQLQVDEVEVPPGAIDALGDSAGELQTTVEALRAARKGERGRAALLLREGAENDLWKMSALRALLEAQFPTPEQCAAALAELDAPVFSRPSLHTAMLRLDVASACKVEGQAWEAALRGALVALLEWSDHKELGGAMVVALRRFGALLPVRERRRWNDRAAALIERFRRGSEQGPALLLSMIGTIGLVREGGESVPVQGARSRTLLGLMAAAAMRSVPPEREEFWRIATGIDDPDELDRARRTMHQAVLRLRELLGSEAVRTDGELPVLDSAVVRVDLLELHRRLGEVEQDLRSGLLLRARPALLAVLGRLRNEVIFPTLYDEFFEAARQEFENRVRRATVQAVRLLVREQDPAAAEELLRAALVAIPEDEEMASLLLDALEGMGRPADAALARLRAEREI